MTSPEPHASRAVEALLAFWADAGIDACLGDAPVDRLAVQAPARAPDVPSPAAPAIARTPGRRSEPNAADRVAEARAAASTADDLESLVAAARAFFPGPTPAIVLEAAAGTPRLLVLGDAPSAEDGAEGGVLRGPRGALVRAMLAAAGLQDGALYAYSAFRRPRGAPEPEAAAQALAAPFVARAVALARPAATLLLGGAAVRGATGDSTPILRLRGSWLDWSPEGVDRPLPALATLGPDFLLKQPGAKKQVWGDVLSLAATLDQLCAAT